MTGRRAVPVLAPLTVGLLVVGILAAGSVAGPGHPSGDGRVAANGLSRSALLDDEPGKQTVGPAVPVTLPAVTTIAGAPPVVESTTKTTRASGRTTTTATGSTAPTLPPGAPPPGPPPTGIPNIRPASSWSAERDGVTARLRMEPAAPVAGQAVRFFIDVSHPEGCCTVLLDLGDGSGGFSMENGAPCGSLPPGARSATTSHTFAAPGAYKATMTVIGGWKCPPPVAPGSPPSIPVFHGVELTACIAVGPGPTSQGGCSPFPTFGPDSIVSPVVDPFCQIRSDCTQASPPRQ